MSLLSRVLRSFRLNYSSAPNTRYNAKRILEKAKRRENFEILNRILMNPKIEKTSDVDDLRNQVLHSNRSFMMKNVDRIILQHFNQMKQYKTGLDYIQFLDEEKKSKLNLFLTNHIFQIYFYKRYDEKGLSEKEVQHIITLYENLRKSFPILDVVSLENTIQALSVTHKWRDCVDLLQEVKKIDKPNSACYSAVAAGAFLNDEENLAWMILEEMFEQDRCPYDVMFNAFIEKIESLTNKEKILLKLEKLFQECGKKDICFSEAVTRKMCNVLKKKGFYADLSSINKRGTCNLCQEQLDNFEVTDEVFDRLKDKIISNVIVRKNIFGRTTPEEFLRFEKFLKEVNNYDVIIDGLNVAYTAGTEQSTHVFSSLLVHVVAYFAEKGKKVIVLGRAHMNRWPKKNMSFVHSHARVFLTQDMSQDDPYLLYCALHCGRNTIVVSNDLMRSHLYLLKDPKDKMMFSRWLSQRQYHLSFVTNEGKVHFKFPLAYTRTMQKNGNNWHIPYNSAKDRNQEKKDVHQLKNEIPNNWLCIRSS